MISYSYHVCIKIKFIPPLCLSLTSGGGGTVGYFTLVYNIIPILKYKDKGWYLDKNTNERDYIIHID